MRFRKFMLDDYLNGEAGQRCWDFFYNFKRRFEERESDPSFYDFTTGLVNGPGYVKPAFSAELLSGCRVLACLDEDTEPCATFDEFCGRVAFEWPDDDDRLGDALARAIQPCIPFLSVRWFLRHPEHAFPYLLPRHFYKLDIVCREFGIDLPCLPPKNAHKARCEYYLETCRALHGLRTACEMSPTEMCVFLYGYAMRFVDEITFASRRRNSKAFLLYASPTDRELFLSKGIDADETTVWQGKPEMEAGDIILLYERAPRSCISSVWRTVTPGFDDPFDSMSGKVFIGEHVAIPEITYSDLERDGVWAKKPLVCARMQNGAGRECSTEEYEALLKMIKTKDPKFDLMRLPPPPEKVEYDERGLAVEHDVEVKLLEPLLRDLGFSEADWVTQYIIRIGRDNTSRPDYIVHLNVVDGSPNAEFVFEAKFSIPTKRQLKKDYGQSLAYGKLLNAKAIALVSREGVWVWPRSGGEVPFPYDGVTFFDWRMLRDCGQTLRMKCILQNGNQNT